MSNVNPGGARGAGVIYTAAGIKHHLRRHKPDHTVAEGSIADQPHDHSRERARRLRQQERRAK